MLQAKWPKIPSKHEARNIIDLTLSDDEDTEITQESLTYDKMKEELESNDEELNMLIGDKTSMISPANLQMPPPKQYLRPDPWIRNKLQWDNRILQSQ